MVRGCCAILKNNLDSFFFHLKKYGCHVDARFHHLSLNPIPLCPEGKPRPFATSEMNSTKRLLQPVSQLFLFGISTTIKQLTQLNNLTQHRFIIISLNSFRVQVIMVVSHWLCLIMRMPAWLLKLRRGYTVLQLYREAIKHQPELRSKKVCPRVNLFLKHLKE